MCHELLPDEEYETQTLMFKCFIISDRHVWEIMSALIVMRV